VNLPRCVKKKINVLQDSGIVSLSPAAVSQPSNLTAVNGKNPDLRDLHVTNLPAWKWRANARRHYWL
jgi:hypothetical protein